MDFCLIYRGCDKGTEREIKELTQSHKTSFDWAGTWIQWSDLWTCVLHRFIRWEGKKICSVQRDVCHRDLFSFLTPQTHDSVPAREDTSSKNWNSFFTKNSWNRNTLTLMRQSATQNGGGWVFLPLLHAMYDMLHIFSHWSFWNIHSHFCTWRVQHKSRTLLTTGRSTQRMSLVEASAVLRGLGEQEKWNGLWLKQLEEPIREWQWDIPCRLHR